MTSFNKFHPHALKSVGKVKTKLHSTEQKMFDYFNKLFGYLQWHSQHKAEVPIICKNKSYTLVNLI